MTFRNTLVPVGTKVLLASFVLSNPGINETVRRTRGRFFVNSDQATTNEMVLVAIGFVVVNDLALAAGAASLPGPISDASDDGWFVWEGVPILSASTDGGSGSIVSGVQPIEFDSKAMRRVEEGFGIAVIAEASGVGAEVSMAVSLLSSRN